MQLKAQIESYSGGPFNCTDAQLQGLKKFIEVESELLGVQGALIQMFIRNGELSHTPELMAWFDNHFDCSNQENVALRSFLGNQSFLKGDNIQCS